MPIARSLRLLSSALVPLALVAGCSSSDSAPAGDDGAAGATCADTTRVLAFPTPAWQSGATLAAPPGDLATELLAEASPATWAADLARVDGWAQHPMIVLPLAGAATAVDASRLAVFGAPSGEASVDLHVELGATLAEDGTSVVLEPRDPLPAGVRDVVIVVRSGAFAGARALPACARDGQADPAYASAAATLPAGTDAELALPMRLATTHEDLGHLYDRVSASPVLQVASVQARTLDSFGAAAPPPAVAALLAPTAASGILELPAYADASGVFHRGADGAPEKTGTTKPGFVVALPATGTAPYPFVLFQHGGGQNKTDLFQLAGPLAEAGFAFVAIDLPEHGDRAPATGGGLDFVSFDALAKTRDEFRQTVADHMAVLTGVDALNAALEPVLGTPHALDAGRAFYQGLSLGGISGSITFATTKNVNAAGLFVAAGGYPEIVAKGLFATMVAGILHRPTPERELLLGVAETILDGADPLAYAQRAEDRSARPRPAVFFQAIGDPVIPEPSSDQWARAFGAALALPKQHAVAGMAELSLPASDNFAFADGGPKATRILIENPMSEIGSADRHGALIVQDYSQREVAHCFQTLLASGSCEVIDTGFASR